MRRGRYAKLWHTYQGVRCWHDDVVVEFSYLTRKLVPLYLKRIRVLRHPQNQVVSEYQHTPSFSPHARRRYRKNPWVSCDENACINVVCNETPPYRVFFFCSQHLRHRTPSKLSDGTACSISTLSPKRLSTCVIHFRIDDPRLLKCHCARYRVSGLRHLFRRVSFSCNEENVAEHLYEKVFTHVQDDSYSNGEHIRVACVESSTGIDGICAFLQGTNDLSGKDIKTLALRIVDHDYKGCSSVTVPVYM